MELLDGETAADASARGPMPIADVMRLGAPLQTGCGRPRTPGLEGPAYVWPTYRLHAMRNRSR
jgi:hypothetical protein